MKGRIIVTIMLLFSSVLITQVCADEGTTVDVTIVSNENITGYINSTSINGSVYYYIDGIEVSSEFESIWSKIGRAQRSADNAYGFAGLAYGFATNNNNAIIVLTSDLENNSIKIYMIRDELIAFEDEYINFKNETTANITGLKIQNTQLKEANDLLSSEVDVLEETLHNLKMYATWFAVIVGVLLSYLLFIRIMGSRKIGFKFIKKKIKTKKKSKVAPIQADTKLG